MQEIKSIEFYDNGEVKRIEFYQSKQKAEQIPLPVLPSVPWWEYVPDIHLQTQQYSTWSSGNAIIAADDNFQGDNVNFFTISDVAGRNITGEASEDVVNMCIADMRKRGLWENSQA